MEMGRKKERGMALNIMIRGEAGVTFLYRGGKGQRSF